MTSARMCLINFPKFEVVPAVLLRARGQAAARALAGAEWVVRRKSDGCYLAAVRGACFRMLHPKALHAALGRQSLAGLRRHLERMPHASPPVLPLTGLRAMLADLGLGLREGRARGLSRVPEPATLRFSGLDRWSRPVWLTPAATVAWHRMRRAAQRDGVVLEAISGYRSHAYQAGIFRRKLARGQTLAQILAVNAAPGYSEHHSGRALDIGTTGEPPAEESFEATAAFDWLRRHAAGFGFSMSYPRGNVHGIVYEPWHWCFVR